MSRIIRYGLPKIILSKGQQNTRERGGGVQNQNILPGFEIASSSKPANDIFTTFIILFLHLKRKNLVNFQVLKSVQSEVSVPNNLHSAKYDGYNCSTINGMDVSDIRLPDYPIWSTVCPKSLMQFLQYTHYIQMDKTSWTHSILNKLIFIQFTVSVGQDFLDVQCFLI